MLYAKLLLQTLPPLMLPFVSMQLMDPGTDVTVPLPLPGSVNDNR